MHIKEPRKNKNGSVSYQFYCMGRDPKTRKNKLYQKTYQLPADCIGKKAVDKFLLDRQKEFQDEVEKLSLGLVVKREKIKFSDFAAEVVEGILKQNPEAYLYYNASKNNLKTVNDKLGHYYLHEINQFIIQDFCAYINQRTYTKTVLTVKKSLRPILKERKLTYEKAAEGSGIAYITVQTVLKVGNNVSSDTATKFCSFLEVPISKYFSVETEESPYSRSANTGLKALVSKILSKAVKRGYIERNYALSEFTDPVTGTEGERAIFETADELQKFMQCVNAEKDIRKKAAFSILLYMGLRIGEVLGLEWSDFNFDTDEIAIRRQSGYAGKEFGVITKAPKTKCSQAVLTAPQGLMALMQEYRAWWTKQKILHGDLWENTDRLFCQDSGKNMASSTVREWLIAFEQKNGLKHVTPHGLRHTNITLQIDNGVDVKTVSARARHAKVQTTLDVYMHRTARADKQAANIIDKVLTLQNA
ncbi:MAG: site-specific integrase [Firmicutes bacterium]|nr:site-specific integrase [Bacillota bacterium]